MNGKAVSGNSWIPEYHDDAIMFRDCVHAVAENREIPLRITTRGAVQYEFVRTLPSEPDDAEMVNRFGPDEVLVLPDLLYRRLQEDVR